MWGSYACGVRIQLFQRCLFVLLLVSRLCFGEAAHAMPHEVAAGEAAAATHQQPCPEHANGAAMHAADHMAGFDTANHKDCCGNGGCDCPCLHLFAVVAPTLTVPLAIIDQARVPASAAGQIADRVSALFRPPA